VASQTIQERSRLGTKENSEATQGCQRKVFFYPVPRTILIPTGGKKGRGPQNGPASKEKRKEKEGENYGKEG